MNYKIEELETSDTVLGMDSEIEGSVKFFGTLTIKGIFRGKISGEGNVIIDENVSVNCDIVATEIYVHGRIFGQLYAEKKVYVSRTGIVYGDIIAPDIKAAKGAVVKGKCISHEIHIPTEEEQAIITPVMTMA